MYTGIPNLGLFERSPFTDMLLTRLLALSPNEMVSYPELNEIARENVQKEGYHLLTSAREIALRDHEIVTDTVVNVGIKRLGPGGVVDATLGRIQRVNRATKKTQRIVATIKDPSVLTPEQRNRFDAAIIIAGVIRLFSGQAIKSRMIKEAAKGEALPSSREVIRASLGVFKG